MDFTDSQIQYGLLIKTTIYLELKKVKPWNMAVWNIMVEGYPTFKIMWNCSRKVVVMDKKS